ncbi:MAG: cyclic nucleotide-binding domain-containing protein [Phycisphaerae bacterium]|nr:cyclic nucleotide-binding domain-containing protein [Phycisphaerae bacterium]
MKPGEVSNLSALLAYVSDPDKPDRSAFIDKCCADLEKMVLHAGQALFQQGDPGNAMYVVMKGHLQATVTQDRGGQIAVWDIGPGEPVGEMEILLGGNRGTNVHVVDDAELAKIDKAGFEAAADESPEAIRQMVQNVRRRLQRIQLLAILPRLLGPVDETTLQDIEQQTEWVHLHRNEVLFRQGDAGDSLYIVVSGRLRVVFEDENGNERVLGELGRGESVGEMALITGEPRSASIYTTRDTQLLKLSKAAFDEIIKRYPQVMMAIAEILVGRLRKKEVPLHTISTVTTIAVLPAGGDVPLADFVERLAAKLTTLGPVLNLSSGRLNGLLGKTGMAQISEHGAHSTRLATWLDEQETKHRFVLYETDKNVSPWTKLCIRQADHVLLVAQAGAHPAPGQIESELLGPTRPITSGRRVLILLHPDGQRLPSGTSRWLAARQVQEHYHLRWDTDADFGRLARFLSGRAIGLALGGGGAHCLAQIGVIRALREAGIPIDIVGGTSMGAVIAVLCAMGHDCRTMIRLNRKGWIESKPFSVTEYALPLIAFFRSRKFDEIAKIPSRDADIADLWLNCFCVSSNLTTSKMVVHRRGPVWKALRASASLPGIAVPVLDSGSLLVDGGVTNNLPGDVVRDLGAGSVIVVNVSSEQRLSIEHDEFPSTSDVFWSRVLPFRQRINVPGILDVLMASTMLSSQARADAVIRDADICFHPPVSKYGLLEFDAIDEIVEVGYRYAKRKIQELQADESFMKMIAAAGGSQPA